MAKPIKIWDGSQWVDVAINVPSITGHAEDTTNVHGITDTANLVYTNDSRLTDSRTPTAHATSHESGGTDEIEIAQSQVTNLTTDLSNKVDKTIVDAKGDLLVGSADNTVNRQALGDNGQVLTVDTSTGTGVKWAAVSAPASATATVSTEQTTTSTSYTDLTTAGPSVTVTTGTKALVVISATFTTGFVSYMSVGISGSTTQSASDSWSIYHSGQASLKISYVYLFTNLTAGSNTFTAKYRGIGGTPGFKDRDIIVINMGS